MFTEKKPFKTNCLIAKYHFLWLQVCGNGFGELENTIVWVRVVCKSVGGVRSRIPRCHAREFFADFCPHFLVKKVHVKSKVCRACTVGGSVILRVESCFF